MKRLALAALAWLALTSGAGAANLSATFFPLFPFDAPPDSSPAYIPIASNQPLEQEHPGITRAIIMVHDFSRDANKALTTLSSLAGTNNADTMLLAPQFLLDSDILRFADDLPNNGRGFARWALGGWSTGADSLAKAPQKPISSFTALDLVLMLLADRVSFPDLQMVIVTGYGEGADFVQRYAATGQAPDILAKQNLPVGFVVVNASSYLYLSAVRPRDKKQGFTAPDEALCKDYNQWPYGLDNMNAYAKRAGANALKTRFAARPVAYLVGDDAARADPAPDSSCAATLQGTDRLTRAINYTAYTGVLFGDAETRQQNLSIVPKIGNDMVALYGSSCGMKLLFGDGDCGSPVTRPSGSLQ